MTPFRISPRVRSESGFCRGTSMLGRSHTAGPTEDSIIPTASSMAFKIEIQHSEQVLSFPSTPPFGGTSDHSTLSDHFSSLVMYFPEPTVRQTQGRLRVVLWTLPPIALEHQHERLPRRLDISRNQRSPIAFQSCACIYQGDRIQVLVVIFPYVSAVMFCRMARDTYAA